MNPDGLEYGHRSSTGPRNPLILLDGPTGPTLDRHSLYTCTTYPLFIPITFQLDQLDQLDWSIKNGGSAVVGGPT